MYVRAQITDCGYGLDGTVKLTLTVPQTSAENAVTAYDKLRGKDLDVSIKKHSEKRSLGANALMWKCLQGLAAELDIGSMEAYIQCLRDYGTYTFIVVPERAVEYTKGLFRIVEEMGTVKIGNEEGVQLQVWPGSSTYNVQCMTRLINGVIRECKDAGAWVPDETDVAVSIGMLEAQDDGTR